MKVRELIQQLQRFNPEDNVATEFRIPEWHEDVMAYVNSGQQLSKVEAGDGQVILVTKILA